jgi:hypothetical protein
MATMSGLPDAVGTLAPEPEDTGSAGQPGVVGRR